MLRRRISSEWVVLNVKDKIEEFWWFYIAENSWGYRIVFYKDRSGNCVTWRCEMRLFGPLEIRYGPAQREICVTH